MDYESMILEWQEDLEIWEDEPESQYLQTRFWQSYGGYGINE